MVIEHYTLAPLLTQEMTWSPMLYMYLLHPVLATAKVNRFHGLHGDGFCYKCQGRGHFQITCNWNGFDKADGQIQCQLCDQNGHNAKCCIKNPSAKRKTNSSSTCQLCGTDGLTAKQCNRLKFKVDFIDLISTELLIS
jgi:hypothetical protein